MYSFKVRVIKGVLTPNKRDEASFKRLLNAYEKNDKEFVLEFKDYNKNINGKQLSLYKAIMCESVRETGNSYKEIEEELFNRFLPTEIKKGLNGYYHKKISLESLNQLQFQTFLTQSVVFLNDFFNLKIKM